MADLAFLAEAAHEAGGHADVALWLTPAFWVGISMSILIGIMLYVRVPSIVAAALDKKIAGIKAMLDEATALRNEAEALKAECATRLKDAGEHAIALKAAAEDEAKEIVKRAKDDASALIERRAKITEEKIAVAERAAIEEIKGKVADVAAAAARGLIAEKHDAEADRKLVDESIASI